MMFFLESVIDDDNTVHHISIHTNTSIHTHTHKNTQHSPPRHIKHILHSSADADPLHSKWHETCIGTLGQLILAWSEQVRPTRNGPWIMTYALWPSDKIGFVCTQRPNWTSDHLHYYWKSYWERRERKRDVWEDRDTWEKRESDERSRKRERWKRERERK